MNTHLLVKQQLPEFIQADYPEFVEFLQIYYRWLDEEFNIGEYEDLVDIDDTVDAFIKYFRKQLDVHGITAKISDQRFYLRHLKDLYTSKGTPDAVKLFFRIVFGLAADIKIPWESVLIPSEAKWVQDTSLLVSATAGDPTDLVGDTISVTDSAGLVYTTVVDRVVAKGAYYELFVDRFAPQNTLETFANADSSITGTVELVPNSVTITQGGYGFKVGDIFEVRDGASGAGSGARIIVDEVGASGVITSVKFLEFGYGYTEDFVVGWAPGSQQTNLLTRLLDLDGTAEDGTNNWDVTDDLTGWVHNTIDQAHTGLRGYRITNMGSVYGNEVEGDFEDGSTGEWTYYGTGATGTLSIASDYSYVGNYSLKISHSGGATGTSIGTRANLTNYSGRAGEVINFTAKARVDRTRNVICRFFEDASQYAFKSISCTANEWTVIGASAPYTVVDNSPSAIRVQINCTDVQNTDELWLDDIRVWTDAATGPAVVVYDKVYNSLPVGAKFTASAWALGSTGATGATVGKNVECAIAFQDSGASAAEAVVGATLTLSDEWQQISVSSEVLPAWSGLYDTVQLRFNMVDGEQDQYDEWFIDDVKLIPVVSPAAAIFSFTLGNLCIYPGGYEATNNILGDETIIQDSDIWQLFSYGTVIEQTLNTYEDLLRKTVHPTGTRLVGMMDINNSAQLTLDVDNGVAEVETEPDEL